MSVVVVKIELAGAVSRVQPFAFGVSFADRRGGGSFRQAEKAMVPQSALRADLSENPLILLAERQTSKLMTRVRFPSPAPASRAKALRLARRPRRPPAEAVAKAAVHVRHVRPISKASMISTGSRPVARQSL
jgi:hypothetical protein